MLIGGGHLIRFDKAVAPGYGPPSPISITRPAIGSCRLCSPCSAAALSSGTQSRPGARCRTGRRRCCAPRSSTAATWRFATPTRATISCRTRTARRSRSCPDTCFGIAGIVDPTRPSDRYLKLRRAVGPEAALHRHPGNAVSGRLRPVPAPPPRAFAGYQFLSVPVGPALGDHDGALAELEDLVTLPSWPDPTVLAEVIAGSCGVVGISLHLAIIAMSFGLPVFRPDSIVVGKYAALAQYETVHTFRHDGEIEPGMVP